MKNWFKITLLTLSLTMIAGCLWFGGEGNISGTVTDANGVSVEGVTITTNPETETLTTISDGKYLLENVKTGNYTIEATKDSITTSKEAILAKPGFFGSKVEDITVDIQFTEYEYKLDLIASYDDPVPGNTEGLAWDGTNLWACDGGTSKIYKYNIDGTLTIADTYNSPGECPAGLEWDGSNIWSCDVVSDKIYKHNMDVTLSTAAV